MTTTNGHHHPHLRRRIGVLQATAINMSQMCGIIKQNGIEIYSILFNHDGSISAATQTLFQNCATAPDHYFLTSTNAQLQNAFTEIGSQLANLRLVQ